ncbi:MAG: MerR family transcriptional regulator [Coriobacteriales bacterium]|nr:MerR family transcriptional regulator [Coriobacteriales bacterium]
MDDEIRHYRIGEFAKKVGVSPDFLKYQEEFGVVNPRQSENSNYRHYAFAQTGRVLASLGYQSLGFTLREIEGILGKDSSETIIGRLKDRSIELESEITHLKACLTGIEAICQAEQLEARSEPWFIKDVPAFAFLPHSHKQDFVDDETVPQILRAWVRWLPLVASTQRIQIVGTKEVDFSWGLTVNKEFAIGHQLPLDAPVQIIEPGRCLVYHQRIGLEETPIATQVMLGRILKKPLAVARAYGLALSGTVYNKILFISHEGQSRILHSVLSLPLVDS